MKSQQPSSTGLRILVVEDEFLLAMDLCDQLQSSGYDTIGPIATVKAALNSLASERPDACILDVNLRGENSADVAALLKEQGVPFLLSSAYGRGFLEQYSAFEGVTNIGKPAPAAQLLALLASLLQHSRG